MACLPDLMSAGLREIILLSGIRPSDVTDDEWAFIAPYLTLMRDDAPQRDHDLREVFNGVRWIVRTGSQ